MFFLPIEKPGVIETTLISVGGKSGWQMVDFPWRFVSLQEGIYYYLGGGFKYCLFSSLFGEMIQFDEHIFQMGGSTTGESPLPTSLNHSGWKKKP